MKLVCSCGIRHFIFDWPAASVEEGGKPMCERHIFCPCQREIVIRTAPKDEPNAPETEEDTKKPKIFSQEALAKAMGLEVPPDVERVNTNLPPENVLVSLTMTPSEIELLKDLVSHYGNVFKPILPSPGLDKEGKPIPPEDKFREEREAYLAFAEKIKPTAAGWGTANTFDVASAVEAKMVRCALSARNVAKRFPADIDGWDDDPNVIGKKAATELREKAYKELEAKNV